MTKAYELMEHHNNIVRGISKFLHLSILNDLNKCKKLGETDISNDIPPELKNHISHKDLYLIQCYYAANATLFVTTEREIFDFLSHFSQFDIKCALRDDFLAEYLGEKGAEF